MARNIRAQAAVDFMMSYGIALVIIFIAVSIIYKVSVASPLFIESLCTASPGFECESYAISASTGILTIQLSQATGGAIVIRGAACSSQPNGIGSVPAYGNVWVTNTATYYPANNALGTGTTIYSDNSNTMMMYCYTNTGVATGQLGSGFTGFVWINYTVPSYGNMTQQVAILNLRYT
jgi:hypothetical protein